MRKSTMVDRQVEERKVEETLKRVYFVLFMVERIVITVYMSVFPDVNPAALFLCLSTFFYTLEFRKGAVAVSQTSLQRHHYAHISFENSYMVWLERAALIISAFLKGNPYRWYIVAGLFVISNTLDLLKELDCWLLRLKNLENKDDGNGSRVMKNVEGDNNDDDNDYSEDDDDSDDNDYSEDDDDYEEEVDQENDDSEDDEEEEEEDEEDDDVSSWEELKSQESAEQYHKKYAKQLLKYLSKCEEDKKNLNEKLNVSKADYEEQSQKWEEERKDLVSKLNNATSLLEHHKDTVDAFNQDRCKWEEEKAKLKSDMEELTSQNEENTLNLMNRFEDRCRESMADKELLRAKLHAAKQSKKYYRGMTHESENVRLQLLEDNKELAAKLQDATMEADHYYTILHNLDKRCRSWLEANYYSNTHRLPT